MGSGGSDSSSTQTLTKQQKKAQAAFWNEYLQGRIGEGLPEWEGGPLYVPMGKEERALYGLYGPMLDQATPLYSSTLDAFNYVLSGTATPGLGEGDVESYLAAHRAPIERQFYQETLPELEAQYQGPGTYWGGVRAKETARATTEFGENLSAWEESVRRESAYKDIELAEAARTRQAAYMGQAFDAYSALMQNATTAEQAIRLDQQLQIDTQFQEWLRTLPEMSPVIEQVLAYLATPMVSVAYQQTTSPAAGALSGLITGAGAGAAIGSVIPGVGTLIGGAVGGAVGGIGGLLGG